MSAKALAHLDLHQPKPEMTWMSTTGLTEIQTTAYPCIAILLSNNTEWATDACKIVDVFPNYYGSWKKDKQWWKNTMCLMLHNSKKCKLMYNYRMWGIGFPGTVWYIGARRHQLCREVTGFPIVFSELIVSQVHMSGYIQLFSVNIYSLPFMPQ